MREESRSNKRENKCSTKNLSISIQGKGRGLCIGDNNSNHSYPNKGFKLPKTGTPLPSHRSKEYGKVIRVTGTNPGKGK